MTFLGSFQNFCLVLSSPQQSLVPLMALPPSLDTQEFSIAGPTNSSNTQTLLQMTFLQLQRTPVGGFSQKLTKHPHLAKYNQKAEMKTGKKPAGHLMGRPSSCYSASEPGPRPTGAPAPAPSHFPRSPQSSQELRCGVTLQFKGSAVLQLCAFFWTSKITCLKKLCRAMHSLRYYNHL